MHPQHPSDPETRFVDHEGKRLAYTVEGKGAHTILAVPGLPGSTRDFRWLAPALDARFKLVRIELPGYGMSIRDGHKGMSIEHRADSVLSLMQELALGPATLLGHSSGGTVIAHIACNHPQLVRNCIFIAANGPRPHHPMRVYRALTSVFGRPIGRRLMRPVLRRTYRALGFPAHLTDNELIYTTLDSAMMDFDLHAENLRGIRCPTMVAWALDDERIPAREFEALEEITPSGPRLHYRNGGHNIQKTHAIEIAAAISGFVDP